MSMIDHLNTQLTEKGWLSISNIYFDNHYLLHVFNTRGFVAYSKSNECFYELRPLDSTHTSIVEHKVVAFDNQWIGQQQNITIASQDSMQHFDVATYAHRDFFTDAEGDLPLVKIPTQAEIEAFTKNPDTGLYDGLDTIITLDPTNKFSTKCLYPDNPEVHYVGAVIDFWKEFYHNHDKFKKYLKDFLNVTDAL